MSAKRERLSERRRRFRLRLRGEKKGVSPVVATLILILIAVAAAAALYLWLVVWQGNLTKGIGQPGAQSTLTIGGSTSVYPFSSLAVSWFEQNNSDVSISDNQGGTSAGLLAVCSGNLNIGASSTPETAASLETTYGCPSTYASTIQVTPIAYDAVDLVIPSANTHGLLSINWDTLTAVYDSASTTQPTLVAPTIDAQPLTSGILDAAPWNTIGTATPTVLQWDQIPAAVQGATFTGLTIPGNSPEGIATSIGAGAACGGTYTADICATAGGASPCGFTVCAGGAVNIAAYGRLDGSGATLTMEAKLFGAVSSKAFATSFSGLGYSGCGSDNLLSDCGINIPTSQQEEGDTGVLNAVAANPNAIGYASDGLARSISGIGIVPFLAVGQSLISGSASSTTAYGAVVPTTGSTGTIAAGITSSTTTNNYAGWRPFDFVSLQPYAGVAQEFITFILDPANNLNLASATHEVSLYSV